MAAPRLPKKQCPCDHFRSNVKKTSKFQKNDLPQTRVTLQNQLGMEQGSKTGKRGEMKTRISIHLSPFQSCQLVGQQEEEEKQDTIFLVLDRLSQSLRFQPLVVYPWEENGAVGIWSLTSEDDTSVSIKQNRFLPSQKFSNVIEK